MGITESYSANLIENNQLYLNSLKLSWPFKVLLLCRDKTPMCQRLTLKDNRFKDFKFLFFPLSVRFVRSDRLLFGERLLTFGFSFLIVNLNVSVILYFDYKGTFLSFSFCFYTRFLLKTTEQKNKMAKIVVSIVLHGLVNFYLKPLLLLSRVDK